MPKFITIIFFLILPFTSSSQEAQKHILFQNDSIWYAAQNQLLFSSTNKGISWDTIFTTSNRADTVFFSGDLDTATNIFIAGAKTLFVFGWDGTMHYKTILFSSSDFGRTWSKSVFLAENGTVGVKYLHKISPAQFFLDRRNGNYSVSNDAGKTWTDGKINTAENPGKEYQFTFLPGGVIEYGYRDKMGKHVTALSTDGGKIWKIY